jgi:hypothetical protein
MIRIAFRLDGFAQTCVHSLEKGIVEHLDADNLVDGFVCEPFMNSSGGEYPILPEKIF